MNINKLKKLINILKNIYACDTVNQAKKILKIQRNKKNIINNLLNN